MLEREIILKELNEISPLVAQVPRVNVFSVQEGYFSGIQEELKARIAADGFYASQNAFTVPEGYFDNLAISVLQKIKGEEMSAFAEIAALSPVIAGIGNKNIFIVPDGYFDQSIVPVVKEPAKLIKMSRMRSVFKYGIAAVITGLLGISVINVVNQEHSTVKAASTEQISGVVADADQIIKNGTFNNELNSVSDQEIEQYLKQSGQDVNAAVIASAASDDAASLPEAADYLLDENALDDYLNKNNLKN
jgi:hypothetical protein